MTRREAVSAAATELTLAEQARLEGNAGKMRVCARRAAGTVTGWWAGETGRPGWPPDALALLKHLAADPGVPEDVRAAAHRLTARILPDFRSPSPEDPVEDARRVIGALLGAEPGRDAGG